MTTIAASPAARPDVDARSGPAVFVAFGITGDLAKVKTFMSLYRLERRGVLDCPILGVPVDDSTVDQLRDRVRRSIEGAGEKLDPKVFDRLSERLSNVPRDAAVIGDRKRFTRQDGIEEAWQVMQPLLDAPPPKHAYPPDAWGPKAADKLLAGHGRWHDPWVSS